MRTVACIAIPLTGTDCTKCRHGRLTLFDRSFPWDRCQRMNNLRWFPCPYPHCMFCPLSPTYQSQRREATVSYMITVHYPRKPHWVSEWYASTDENRKYKDLGSEFLYPDHDRVFVCHIFTACDDCEGKMVHAYNEFDERYVGVLPHFVYDPPGSMNYNISTRLRRELLSETICSPNSLAAITLPIPQSLTSPAANVRHRPPPRPPLSSSHHIAPYSPPPRRHTHPQDAALPLSMPPQQIHIPFIPSASLVGLVYDELSWFGGEAPLTTLCVRIYDQRSDAHREFKAAGGAGVWCERAGLVRIRKERVALPARTHPLELTLEAPYSLYRFPWLLSSPSYPDVHS